MQVVRSSKVLQGSRHCKRIVGPQIYPKIFEGTFEGTIRGTPDYKEAKEDIH